MRDSTEVLSNAEGAAAQNRFPGTYAQGTIDASQNLWGLFRRMSDCLRVERDHIRFRGVEVDFLVESQ